MLRCYVVRESEKNVILLLLHNVQIYNTKLNKIKKKINIDDYVHFVMSKYN